MFRLTLLRLYLQTLWLRVLTWKLRRDTHKLIARLARELDMNPDDLWEVVESMRRNRQ